MKYLCVNDEGYDGAFTEGLTYTCSAEHLGLVELISNDGSGIWISVSSFKEDFIPIDIAPAQAEANYAFHHPQASF